MYYPFIDEYTGHIYGSFEVFYKEDSEEAKGWYWWCCYPSCLPDGDVHGPFLEEQLAVDDARWGA